ncbi:MAG TPA: lipoate protein ligase C-terminal domain-containing protein [Candidatus Thermoplasmatota archaeon]|nr:lipoate protein ligase C-terminal domain-containing protein [Candidatus Thermoplasmatota archaeon]
MKRLCYHSIYKVPRGKLLRISLEYNPSTRTIHHVRITGDFFAYPEEAVELVEQALEQVVFERDHLRKKLESIIRAQKIQFIGVDAEGLTQAILACSP